MLHQKDTVVVSTDKHRLDIAFIHRFLTGSYWAAGRSIEQVEKSIEQSVCFGLYVNGQQAGFARVLTDKVAFAYLMDVFIAEQHRGKGYSKMLLREILACPELSEVGKWMLATRDAHDLYRQFQFTGIPQPEKYMERIAGRG